MYQFVSNIANFLTAYGFDDHELWLLGLLIFLAVSSQLFFWRSLLRFILTLLSRYSSDENHDHWLDIITKIRPQFIIFNAIYAAILVLPMPRWIKVFFTVAFIVVTTIFVIDLIRTIVINSVKVYLGRRGNVSPEALNTVVNFTSVFSTLILWLITIIIFLLAIKVDIQGLLSGLGIASVVIAFSFQSVLKDIFAFFTVYVDRSFSVGDYVSFDNFEGNIKEIRLRTTRLKALLGNEMIVPNATLASLVIQNYNRFQKRRISFTFKTKVVTADLVERAVADIREQLSKAPFDERVTLNTVVVSSLSDYGLEFKIIYRFAYLPGHKNFYEHLETRHQVYLTIMRVMSKYHIPLIQLEYPHQAV